MTQTTRQPLASTPEGAATNQHGPISPCEPAPHPDRDRFRLLPLKTGRLIAKLTKTVEEWYVAKTSHGNASTATARQANPQGPLSRASAAKSHCIRSDLSGPLRPIPTSTTQNDYTERHNNEQTSNKTRQPQKFHHPLMSPSSVRLPAFEWDMKTDKMTGYKLETGTTYYLFQRAHAMGYDVLIPNHFCLTLGHLAVYLTSCISQEGFIALLLHSYVQ